MCFYNTRPHIPYYEEHLVDPYAPPPAEPLGVREVYVNADSTTPNAIDLAYCFHDHEQDSHSLTYSVSGGDPSIATAYMSSATVVSFQGGGTPGVTSVTVTATDWYGATGQMTISVYACRVTGYEVQERAWGQDWGDPEDADKTSNWAVLWRSDYQKWLPKVEPQAVQNKITGVNWSYAPEGSTYYQSFANTDSFAWCYGIPYAEFEKWALDGGEDDYDRLGLGPVEIRPSVVFGAIDRAYLNRGTCVSMVDTGPSADQPDISMHDVSSVQWVPQLEQTTTMVDGSERNLSKLSGGVAYPNVTYDEFLVDVQITSAIPSRMTGTVWLAWYDPCDYDFDGNGPVYTDNLQGMQWLAPQPLEFVGNTESASELEGVFGIAWQDPTKIGLGDDYVAAAHPRSGAQSGYNWREATMCGCGTGQWILHHDDYEDPLHDEEPIGFDPTSIQKVLPSRYQTGKIEVGAEIFINHDDDTMNGIPDKDDPVPLTTAQDTDLYELDLGIAPITSGEVSLSYDTNLRMWASRDKQLLPTPIDYVFNGTRVLANYDTATFPSTVYVEGAGLGGSNVVWYQTSNGHLVHLDSAKIDVVPTTWKGWDVPAYWRISHTRQEQVMGDDDGVIQTPYPYESALGVWEGAHPNYRADTTMPVPTMEDPNDPTQTIPLKEYKIDVTYSFAEGPNSINHFVDADNGQRKPGFFSNSGVYIENKCEIQIFNTPALRTAMDAGTDQNGIRHYEPNSVIIDGVTVETTGDVVWDDGPKIATVVMGDRYIVSTNPLQYAHSDDWTPENVNALISGVPYGVQTYDDITEAKAALGSAPGEGSLSITSQKLDGIGGILNVNDPGNSWGTIDISAPDTEALLDCGLTAGGKIHLAWGNGQGCQVTIASASLTSVEFSDATTALPPDGTAVTLGDCYRIKIGSESWALVGTGSGVGRQPDGLIHLQQHWGSGVVFSDATVKPVAEP